MSEEAEELPRALTILELPESDRPREKLAAQGAAALSDAELLAILLRTGIQGTSALEMGRGLLARYQSLAALSRCSVPELAKIRGMGLAKAVQLAAAFGLASRLARSASSARRSISPDLVYELLGPEMRMLQKESLRVVLLDTKFQLLRVESHLARHAERKRRPPAGNLSAGAALLRVRLHPGAQSSLRRPHAERRRPPADHAPAGRRAALASRALRSRDHRQRGE